MRFRIVFRFEGEKPLICKEYSDLKEALRCAEIYARNHHPINLWAVPDEGPSILIHTQGYYS